MKLYLSSYHLCNEPTRLSSLPAKNKRVAVVRNALDQYTDAGRLREGLEEELRDLAAIGLLPTPLDLRLFFGKTDELEAHLHRLDRNVAVVCYCKSGIRSARAAALLVERGFRDVVSLDGGIQAWTRDIERTDAIY